MEITLNLLPPRQLQRRLERQRQRRRVLFVVVAIVGVFLVYLALNGRIALIRAQTASLERQTVPFRPLAAQVRQLEAERDALQRRQEAVQQLVSGSTRWSVVLDALASAVPKDVWLTSLQIGGATLAIEGRSTSQAGAARFVLGLQQTPVVATATLRLIREEAGPPRVFAFQVLGTLKSGGATP